jgi:DNA-binding MarR family transcriptional regulator
VFRQSAWHALLFSAGKRKGRPHLVSPASIDLQYVDINTIQPMPADVPYQTTLLVRDCCLCLHVQRAARALARRFDEALRPLDLTNGQLSLIMSLNRPEPPTMKSVATLLAMDRTTLTAALKPLERRGLIRVAPDKEDRRNRLLSLTARGKKLLARAVPIWQQTHIEVEALLPDKNPDHLRKSLRALS